MTYVLLAVVILALLWALSGFILPLMRPPDYGQVASGLDREGAHDMLDKHVTRMALGSVLPGQFDSSSRDADAAIAAMARILEIEGENRDADSVRAFITKLAEDKADAMVRGKQPIVIGDLWPL